MDIEILPNLLNAKKEYVPPCLEFYFDIYGSLDGANVKKDLGHSNVLMVWSVLYHDKMNLKQYGGEFSKDLVIMFLLVVLSIQFVLYVCQGYVFCVLIE